MHAPAPAPLRFADASAHSRQRIKRAVLGSTMNSGVLSSAKFSLRSFGQLIDPHHPTSDFQLLPHLKSSGRCAGVRRPLSSHSNYASCTARTSSLAKIVRPMPIVALVGRMTCKVGMGFVLKLLYGSVARQATDVAACVRKQRSYHKRSARSSPSSTLSRKARVTNIGA